MGNLNTEQLLGLVQQALAEIDDRPVDVSARRAARVASLLGETVLAVYLGLELKTLGGLPTSNAEDTRRLMADPSVWADSDGPHEEAFQMYVANREIKGGGEDGKILAFGLAEIETWLDEFGRDLSHSEIAADAAFRRGIRDRVRHKIFTALCSWERQLTYANVNERIFERFRSRADTMLATGAPDLLDQFAAVYRRLGDATRDPSTPVAEELAQAVATCRRILKAVADHVLPGVPGAQTDEGRPLDDSAYRNRIYEFVKQNVSGDSTKDSVKAAVGGIHERFTALDKLASKGVHAEVAVPEAELCAIGTYLVAGELLSIASGGH